MVDYLLLSKPFGICTIMFSYLRFYSRDGMVSICKFITGNLWVGFIVTDVTIATVCGFNFFSCVVLKGLTIHSHISCLWQLSLTQTGCITKFTHKFLIADSGSRWQPVILNCMCLWALFTHLPMRAHVCIYLRLICLVGYVIIFFLLLGGIWAEVHSHHFYALLASLDFNYQV